MTRKDYVVIAGAIRAAGRTWTLTTERDTQLFKLGAVSMMNQIIGGMSAALAQENPRFDAVKFEEAAWGDLI